MSTVAIVQRQESALTAFEPHDLEEAFKLSQRLVASGLLPKSITKPESALAIVIAGRELGLTAMQSLRSIFIIEGKPMLSADLMLALVKKSPVCAYFRLLTSTKDIATYETLRSGDPDATRLSFTIAQAQAAGVAGKDNWKKYPEAMLRARCIAALARAVYPDLLMGIYDPDEIEQAAPTRTPLRAKPTSVAPVDEVIDAVPVESAELTADEQVAHWVKQLDACNTKEELARANAELKGENLPKAIKQRLMPAFEEATKRVTAEVIA